MLYAQSAEVLYRFGYSDQDVSSSVEVDHSYPASGDPTVYLPSIGLPSFYHQHRYLGIFRELSRLALSGTKLRTRHSLD